MGMSSHSCTRWSSCTTGTTGAPTGSSSTASDAVTIVTQSKVMPVKWCTFLVILLSVKLPIGNDLPSSCNWQLHSTRISYSCRTKNMFSWWSFYFWLTGFWLMADWVIMYVFIFTADTHCRYICLLDLEHAKLLSSCHISHHIMDLSWCGYSMWQCHQAPSMVNIGITSIQNMQSQQPSSWKCPIASTCYFLNFIWLSKSRYSFW